MKIKFQINPSLLISATIIISTLIVVSGWVYTNYQASKRDYDNKLRDIRTSYLIDVYRKFADCSQQDFRSDIYNNNIVSALSDIQLFGTKSQVDKAIRFMNQYPNSTSATLDSLLNDLRNDFRIQLKLDSIHQNVKLRIPAKVATDSGGKFTT